MTMQTSGLSSACACVGANEAFATSAAASDAKRSASPGRTAVAVRQDDSQSVVHRGASR